MNKSESAVHGKQVQVCTLYSEENFFEYFQHCRPASAQVSSLWRALRRHLRISCTPCHSFKVCQSWDRANYMVSNLGSSKLRTGTLSHRLPAAQGVPGLVRPLVSVLVRFRSFVFEELAGMRTHIAFLIPSYSQPVKNANSTVRIRQLDWQRGRSAEWPFNSVPRLGRC